MFCKICTTKTSTYLRRLYDNRHGYSGRFDIHYCPNCGFMQTFPQLKRSQLSKLYTKYYPRQEVDTDAVRKAGKNAPSVSKIFWEGLSTSAHYKTEPGNKVLDVGSGIGYSLVEIKALGGKAWGIDPDQNAKKVAKKLKLNFHMGFLHTAPFPKGYFDLITASQVIEHEPDPLKFLRLMKRYLKKNGRIVLTFPNTGALYRKLWGRNWLHWHIPYHLNHFNKSSFKRLAYDAGLQIVSLKTVTPNLWTMLQLKSYLKNTKEGVRDPMWDGDESTAKTHLNRKRNLLIRVLPVIKNLLVINRIIDLLGYGESFVVELKQKRNDV